MRPTPARDPSAPPSARPAPEPLRPRADPPLAMPAPVPAALPAAPPSAAAPPTAVVPPPAVAAAPAVVRPTPRPVAKAGADYATEAAADERIRRYEQALTDPVVQDLIKRFEADILAREPGDRAAWLERLKRS